MPIYVGTAQSSFLASNRFGLPAVTNATRNAGVGTPAGSLIYNTTNFAVEAYSGAAWRTVKSALSATGGTYSQTPGGANVHTFTSTGTFVVNDAPPSISVSYLLVGGGGGGGMAGGGGAGGFRTGTFSVTGPYPKTYTIIVGAGGHSGVQAWPNTSNMRGSIGASSGIYAGTAPTRAYVNDPTLLYYFDSRNKDSYPGTGSVINNLSTGSTAGSTCTLTTTPGGAPSVLWSQNNGFYFPGNTASPNFIAFPASMTALTFPAQVGVNTFSIEMRMRMSPTPMGNSSTQTNLGELNRNAIISGPESNRPAGAVTIGFIGSPQGATNFGFYTGSGDGISASPTSISTSVRAPAALVPFVPDTEYHIVVSRSPTNIITCYRNNIAIATAGISSSVIVQFVNNHLMGGFKATQERFSDYFGGHIKLFRAYKKELSAAERTTNFNETETLNPSFVSLEAYGGGYGGNNPSAFGSGSPGGSGGGAGGILDPVTLNSVAGGTGNTPPASPSQGNTGGSSGSTTINLRAAGGGGAGGAGGNGGGGPGAGGNGTASSISGLSVTYAGGGGGSTAPAQPAPSVGGSGGTGGGGAGGSQTVSGQPGTANLGGGGGGGYPNGGTGGSGIVIISY